MTTDSNTNAARETVKKAREAVTMLRDYAMDHGMSYDDRDLLIMSIHRALDLVKSPASPPGQASAAADDLAKRFHETYERLAPVFGYETRKESAVPWDKVPEKNRKLMIAVCAHLLAALSPGPSDVRKQKDEQVAKLQSFKDWQAEQIAGEPFRAIRILAESDDGVGCLNINRADCRRILAALTQPPRQSEATNGEGEANVTTYSAQMSERFKAGGCDWKGALKRRFRWRKWRFEFGRWCYIVHPIQGGSDIVWWEWESDQAAPATKGEEGGR